MVPTAGGAEKQLTFGGHELLLNGELDWVYPEELGLETGYHWSPDSRHIGFFEIDESPVPIYPISDLISRQATVDLQRYPKAGDPNPRVRVGIVDIEDAQTVWIDRAAEYIARIQWANPSTLAVQLLNLASGATLPFHEGLVVNDLDLVKPDWKLLDTPKSAKVGLLLLQPTELENKKYPVLVYVYGMLGVPTIRDAWSVTTTFGQKVAYGAHLRYLVWSSKSRRELSGCVQFSSSARRLRSRDGFIGWDDATRQKNLRRVVNNSRFLILPWFSIKGLASHVLSLAARVVVDDWEEAYGVRPVLLETFVERERNEGTCYLAANWMDVGSTTGRGRMDRHNKEAKPVKRCLVYPLVREFRRELGVVDEGRAG